MVSRGTGKRARPKRTGPSLEVRELILWRDEGRCQWCGKYTHQLQVGQSIQHRRARGMGGTTDASTNHTSNLVLMCGSGTTGCHGWVESHPTDALARGFRVPQGTDPATVPLIDHEGRRWLLDNEGHRRRA